MSGLFFQHHSSGKHALDLHAGLRWLASGTDINCSPVIFTICDEVLLSPHVTHLLLHSITDSILVSAKRHLFAVWVMGFARWGEDSPATKTNRCRNPTEHTAKYLNLKIRLAS